MSKRSMSLTLLLAIAGALAGQAQTATTIHQPTLTAQQSGTTQLLIAVSPVNANVVWAAGTGGTYTVTTDGGATWKSGVVPGAEKLQFRDVQGVSEKVAYLMSIGENTEDFRIFKTEDGGAQWTTLFKNTTKNAFYDCFAFWGPDHGIAHSDSVNGVFPDIRTFDGTTWHSIADKMPPALPMEASFSSSGTCITTQGTQHAWVATGGSSVARILATEDGGDTWNAYDTPFVSNPNAGGFSVAFRDAEHGIVGGGDLTNDNATQAAVSENGGKTWKLATKPAIPGSIFALSYATGDGNLNSAKQGSWIAEASQSQAYNRTVVITTETLPDFAAGAAAWFVGNNGKIGKTRFYGRRHSSAGSGLRRVPRRPLLSCHLRAALCVSPLLAASCSK